MATISITTQKSKKNDEMIHVFLRLNIGEKKRLKKVCTIESKNWNHSEKKAIGANAQSLNRKIQILKSDLEKLAYHEEVFGDGLSLDIVKNKKSELESRKKLENNEDILFYDFAKKEIELMTGVYAGITVRHYKSKLNNLHKFNPKLTLTNITFEFLQKYEQYLIKLGNSTNTIGAKFKFIKVILNLAKKKGLKVNTPFDNFKVKRVDTSRDFLTPEELIRCFDLYKQNILSDKHQNVLEYFLFSCFTGCRYSALENLLFRRADNLTAFLKGLLF